MILVTGGAGFIGANFVLEWLSNVDEAVVNLDALTYAGNLENLASLNEDERHIFEHGSIAESQLVSKLLGSMPFPVEIDFSTDMTVGGRTARS